MKKVELLTFFLIVTLLVVFPINYSLASKNKKDEVAEAHQEAIQAIENWLDQIPRSEYIKAKSDAVFQWKLKIEENHDTCETFKLYNEILREIENKEFVYNVTIFNKKTLLFFQLSLYYACYNNSSKTTNPSRYLDRVYNFYRNNVNSKEEQWIWLDQILSFLAGGRFGDARPKLTAELASGSYGTISSLLKEYLFVSDYVINNKPKVIKNKEIYYAENPGGWATYDSTNLVLKRIYHFVKQYKENLKEGEKEAIKKFLLPSYQENDYTVKTYSLIRNNK